MNDPPQAEQRAAAKPLAPALEARIATLERSASPSDFDRASWGWMALLGIAVPLGLILIGWWA